MKYLLATNLVGRLPNGMAPLGIALHLRSEGAGFGLVGGLTALYGLCVAVGGPLLGRAVDRRGQGFVLIASALASATGFVWLVLQGTAQPLLTAAAVAVAGLFSPPLESCLRALWIGMLPSRRLLTPAFALDASLQQIVFVSGPLLIVLIGSVWSSGTALLVVAATVAGGTLAFIAPPVVRNWRGEPHTPDWAGPLRSPELRRLLISLGCVGVALGAINIGAVAHEEYSEWPGLSGLLLGVNSFGALLGGLIFGAHTWRTPAHRQLRFLLIGMVLSFLPLALVLPPLPTAALMFCAGAFLSPVLTCGFSIVGDLTPAGMATEAFAWVVTAVLSGNAAGSSLAGLTRQHASLGWTFLIPGVAAALAMAVVAKIRIPEREGSLAR
ncbi:MFS transporter [Streptomyces sp. NPDC048258]|uniref:MFS transporter n=1 Tax=Streptomyces sp. NPDC048258 TaxID=3365527 RepID=UPI0037108B9C